MPVSSIPHRFEINNKKDRKRGLFCYVLFTFCEALASNKSTDTAAKFNTGLGQAFMPSAKKRVRYSLACRSSCSVLSVRTKPASLISSATHAVRDA